MVVMVRGQAVDGIKRTPHPDIVLRLCDWLEVYGVRFCERGLVLLGGYQVDSY